MYLGAVRIMDEEMADANAGDGNHMHYVLGSCSRTPPTPRTKPNLNKATRVASRSCTSPTGRLPDRKTY
jgi:hypothetical protein